MNICRVKKFAFTYITEEKLGIRLEDDLVVQDNGAPLNLMSDIPLEADEIEALMNG